MLLLLISFPIDDVWGAKQPLRSAAEIDYPPFSIVDDEGHADGFSVELMRAALAMMGRDVTFKIGPWAEVRGWLERGEIDALPLVGRTPEREALFDFTIPYMTLHGAIVVRKANTDIHGLEDLRGRQVAVMRGDNAEEFLRREDRGIDIHTTATFGEALRRLSEGRYDAVFIQRLVALRLIRKNGLLNLKIIDKPVEEFKQDFCFAVTEGDRDTLALLNEGLALVIADGTHRHLHAKWFAKLELPTRRKIIIGGDHNYPPFEFLDENGKPTGYNVDLSRAIAREVGLDIEIRLGPWEEMRRALARHEIDALQGMLYSTERDLTFDFTPAHTINHCVAVVRKGEGPVPALLQELTGKDIVVQRGDIMHDFLIENGLGDQAAVTDAQEGALRQLAGGKHDCALVARLTALYWIDKYGWDNLVVGKQAFLSPEYCYAVPNNRKALLAQLSEGLKILENTGEYRRIQEKWMGVYEEEKPNILEIARDAAFIIGPLLLILLASFLWTRSLRRQVASRTESLQKSEEFQKAMVQSSPVALYSIDFEGRVLSWNESAERIFGWKAGEVIGNFLPIIPDDKMEEYADLRERILNGQPILNMEVTRLKKDNTTLEGSLSATAIRNSQGEIIGIMGAMEDITQRKQAERSLVERNQFIQTILDNLPIGLAVNNIDDEHLVYMNPKFEEIYGWRREELEDVSTFFEKVYPDESYRENIKNQVMADIQSGDQEKMVWGDIEATGRNGRKRFVLARNIPLYQQNLMISTVQDVTESRSLAAQLTQAQKMESVGRLAGGVAHDFNNMLSLILGHAELALEKIDPDEPLHEDLKEILGAGKRSADLIRQLLAFARKQTVSPRLLDLNETVEGMLKMLRRLIGEDIDLAWLPDNDLWPVKIDPAQVDQLMANLCVNARDAIVDVGKITIETKNMSFDAEYCAEHAGFIPGDYAMIAVSDDGTGMDREMLDKIFEPFYTTKDAAEGTGLGLSTVYGIVKQNDGFINVYSEPDEGTTFRVYLPRQVGDIDTDTPRKKAALPLDRELTVLMVEDEEAVLKLGINMLVQLNCNVIGAATPEEAIDLAGQEKTGRIDLLITDVVMPKMNGKELADRLKSQHPHLKVLFMSGYTANVIAHRGIVDAGVCFIQKPFSKDKLAEKVLEALEEDET